MTGTGNQKNWLKSEQKIKDVGSNPAWTRAFSLQV